jgi:hypothetical protein
MKRVTLGDEVRDMVTGYKGIAVGLFEYLHGCTRVCVQARMGKDGKTPDPLTFDEPQLEVLTQRKVKVGEKDTGGPAPYRDSGR